MVPSFLSGSIAGGALVEHSPTTSYEVNNEWSHKSAPPGCRNGAGIKKKKKRLRCTLVQALRFCTGRTAHRGSRCINLLFLDHGTRRGEGSASRLGRSLPPEKNRYPLYRRLGGPQSRSGLVRKISSQPVFDARTFQPLYSHCTE